MSLKLCVRCRPSCQSRRHPESLSRGPLRPHLWMPSRYQSPLLVTSVPHGHVLRTPQVPPQHPVTPRNLTTARHHSLVTSQLPVFYRGGTHSIKPEPTSSAHLWWSVHTHCCAAITTTTTSRTFFIVSNPTPRPTER